MKYIIDIPEEAIEFMGGRINVFVEPECKVGDCKHYALRISKEDIEPYTEPDLNPLVDEAVETIENEVWEFARNILNYTDDDWDAIERMLLIDKCTYQEAKNKYEKWMKQRAEIRVGDECLDEDGDKCVVAFCVDDSICDVIYDNGLIDEVYKDFLKKTGRHYDYIEKLLKKMKEEQ